MVIRTSLLLKIIFAIFGTIVIGHISGVVYGISNFIEDTIITDLFFFGHEKNITALYSSALFLLIGYCFHQLSIKYNKDQKNWKLLRNICAYLACDEWFAIHDALLNPLGLGPLKVPYWVWIYAVIFVFILINLLPFIKKIPKSLLKYLIPGAIVFIAGAAIMEVVTYSIPDFFDVFFQFGLFFEDGLEMAGLLIASYGCLKHTEVNQTLVFPKTKLIIISIIAFADGVFSNI